MSYNLIVENYGKIENAEIEVKPLTLFVGDNNSGKSYLLSLVWALYSGEGSSILYRGIGQLLREQFGKIYCDIERLLLNEPISKESDIVIIEEQDLIQIVNELFKMNKDDFVKSLFNYNGMSIGKIVIQKSGNGQYRLISSRSVENRIRIEVNYGDKACTTFAFDKLEGGENIHVKWLVTRLIRQLTEITLKENIGTNSAFYLPAARTGFMLAKNTINQVGRKKAFDIELEVDDGVRNSDVSPFPKPIIHFLDSIDTLNFENENSIDNGMIDWINNNMTNGNVDYMDNNSGNIQYIPNGMEKGIPLRATSGVVTELTPLILLLKYARSIREICYEEPEMCLHPQLQYKMARLMVRMVNMNIGIVASTHSDIIIQHINNMCQLYRTDDVDFEKLGLGMDDVIDINNIAVYQFKEVNNRTRVDRIIPDNNQFKIPSFSNALKMILNQTLAVSDLLHDEEE